MDRSVYTPSPPHRSGEYNRYSSESVRSRSLSYSPPPRRRYNSSSSSESRSPSPQRRHQRERTVVSLKVPSKIDQDQVRTIFEFFAKVQSVQVDKSVAYVKLFNASDAQECVACLNGGVIDTVNIQCELMHSIPDLVIRQQRSKPLKSWNSYRPTSSDRSRRRRSPSLDRRGSRKFRSRSPYRSRSPPKRRRRLYSRSRSRSVSRSRRFR